MIDIGKALSKLANKSEFITRTYTASNITVSANNAAWAFDERDVSVEGYEAISVSGISVSGNNLTAVIPQRWELNENKLRVAIRNVTSNNVTVGAVYAKVLYQKVGG